MQNANNQKQKADKKKFYLFYKEKAIYYQKILKQILLNKTIIKDIQNPIYKQSNSNRFKTKDDFYLQPNKQEKYFSQQQSSNTKIFNPKTKRTCHNCQLLITQNTRLKKENQKLECELTQQLQIEQKLMEQKEMIKQQNRRMHQICERTKSIQQMIIKTIDILFSKKESNKKQVMQYITLLLNLCESNEQTKKNIMVKVQQYFKKKKNFF